MKPNRVQKGDVALLTVAARLTEVGLFPLKPFCEALPFDLALYFEGRFYRIQVKRAQKYKKTGRWEIPFRKTTSVSVVRFQPIASSTRSTCSSS